MTDRPRPDAQHPLRGAFPLAVMTLAAFLVLFTVMMARLSAGADPALHTSTTTLVAKRSGPATPITRTSGATSIAALPSPSSKATSAGESAIVTRARSGKGEEGSD